VTSPAERSDQVEAARVADEVSFRLRTAGFPEIAITAWWQWLADPTARLTPHRVWESGDYTSLRNIADKTLRNIEQYRRALEEVISAHFAEQLAQSNEVRGRLFGAAQ